MRALALDVGSKTIGIAVGALDTSIAHPHSVLARAGHQADAAKILALTDELEAEVVVVGLPLELDGSEGHRARLVQRFVDALAPMLGGERESRRAVRIERWDERFSTSAAERALLEADVRRAKRKQTIDAVAAAFILQGWLDAQARKREDQERR